MGSSLACFTINAFFSSALKVSQGFVELKYAIPLCLGTLVGSNIGAILNGKFSPIVLKILFGIMFLIIAAKFIITFSMA